MTSLKRWNLGLIACFMTLCLFLTACPAPGDGTVDGADPGVTAPADESPLDEGLDGDLEEPLDETE